jgi:hypothetical protein
VQKKGKICSKTIMNGSTQMRMNTLGFVRRYECKNDVAKQIKAIHSLFSAEHLNIQVFVYHVE